MTMNNSWAIEVGHCFGVMREGAKWRTHNLGVVSSKSLSSHKILRGWQAGWDQKTRNNKLQKYWNILVAWSTLSKRLCYVVKVRWVRQIRNKSRSCRKKYQIYLMFLFIGQTVELTLSMLVLLWSKIGRKCCLLFHRPEVLYALPIASAYAERHFCVNSYLKGTLLPHRWICRAPLNFLTNWGSCRH